MKKIILFLLLSLLLCTFVSCSQQVPITITSNPSEGLSVEIFDLEYGFLPIEEGNNETPDYSQAKKYNALNVDTQYYLVIDFSICVMNDNNGQGLLRTVLTLADIDVLNGKIEEVGSGQFSEMTFTNAETGGQGKTSTVSFRIPEQKYAIRDYRMVIKMIPNTFGSSNFSLNFTSSDAILHGNAVDGITKGLEIKRVTLEAPTLVFDSASLLLSWNHVKNASYYKIFVDGIVLKDSEGNDIIVTADQYIEVGHKLIYPNLSSHFSGTHIVRVQAFSNSANFLQSSYSNDVVAVI